MNRVSAGFPALTVEKKQAIESTDQGRELARQAILDEYGKVAATVAPDGDADTTNLLRQLGRPLSNAEILRRIRLLNPNIRVEPSLGDASKQVLYILENIRTDTGGWETSKKYICGMEAAEIVPEFSVRHAETRSIPDPSAPGHWQTVKRFTHETRGWRTVLARLIRWKLVSPAATERLFDIPAGRSSRNWQQLTQ